MKILFLQMHNVGGSRNLRWKHPRNAPATTFVGTDEHEPLQRMYVTLRTCLRAGLHLYCGRIHVDASAALSSRGPLLLACNHPNTFFDALMVATHLPQHMTFLARGDVFRDPRAARILRALFMIPVYPMREGRPELRRTEETFEQAQMVLERGNSLLVFSEGSSMNATGLRPLGKSTARIAQRAWSAGGAPMQVLPMWLRYGGFHRPFMEVRMITGEPMTADAIMPDATALFRLRFNEVLRERLLDLAVRTDQMDARDRALTRDPSRTIIRSLLLLPAFAGLILHAPWYFALRVLTGWSLRDPVFLDAVLFVLLFLTYPLWLLALVWAGIAAGYGAWAVCIAMAAPLLLAALRRFRIG